MTQMFPTDVAGTLTGTKVILDRQGSKRGGMIMQYQHFVPAYTVPVQLDNGRWTAATKAEVQASAEATEEPAAE